MLGLNGQGFQPDKLSVIQIDKQWAIVAGDVPLFRFGNNPDEAKQALQVIQRHKFDSIYHLGPADQQGLTFLARMR
jgi:hypothetical protein